MLYFSFDFSLNLYKLETILYIIKRMHSLANLPRTTVEVDYRLYVSKANNCAHIQTYWGAKITLLVSL